MPFNVPQAPQAQIVPGQQESSGFTAKTERGPEKSCSNCALDPQNRRFLWINHGSAEPGQSTHAPNRSAIVSHVSRAVHRQKRGRIILLVPGPAPAIPSRAQDIRLPQSRRKPAELSSSHVSTRQAKFASEQQMQPLHENDTEFVDDQMDESTSSIPRVAALEFLRPLRAEDVSKARINAVKDSLYFCEYNFP